ncbi:hypothetical protein CKA81_11760 [Pollutimonas thiosulfatoxidans]|uniref:HNH nuclease domain-containing protein n=2 Tax=Pollutimonas thiosulfatoxidans TaxID=2028345 RepID=A0A410GDR1_9BURK|nr:hypothetical protein CKA81_11760 [Pollutimonas thiosulfatoxidans]
MLQNAQSVSVRTSDALTQGNIYSRAQLREMFDISDATINTGVFRPKGHDSVWLFVTERKTADRTQYEDVLEHDTLYWQGQTSGRTDDLIREHQQRGLELLLFYRHAKYEHPGAAFRYEGPFAYSSDEGRNPVSFVLKREHADLMAATEEEAQHSDAFDPQSIEDGRKRIATDIVRRRGQPAFRHQLIAAYGGRCAITECNVVDVLEAAHIYPYRGSETNVVTNGLLLRTDIHTLFDLGWITINADDYTVTVHQNLRQSEYGQWHGKLLKLPTSASMMPSREALEWHQSETGKQG